EVWTTLECFHVFKTVLVPNPTVAVTSPYETLVSNDWKPEIAACKHEWGDGIDWPKTQCLHCNEYRLFQFQINSCLFTDIGIQKQKGVLQAHDMGLGKTVIALSNIKFHPELTPTLYVVKSKTKFQWLKEIM